MPSRVLQTRSLPSKVERGWSFPKAGFLNTVLAVSNCVGHDSTSYAVLKCVEMGFWCGTCRCDTGTQSWVHRGNVKADNFGARILKRKPPGGGAMPKRREIWLFEGVKVDEMHWNFYRRILTPWPTIFTGIHSPGPLALWASMQKPCVRVERLLGSVKQQKESNRVTLWQVNKIHRWQLGNLDVDCQDLDCLLTLLVSLIRCAKLRSPDCYLSLLLMTAIQTAFCRSRWWRPSGLKGAGLSSVTTAGDTWTVFSRYLWCWQSGPLSLATARDNLDCLEISQLSSMNFVYLSKCHPVALFLLLHRTAAST